MLNLLFCPNSIFMIQPFSADIAKKLCGRLPTSRVAEFARFKNKNGKQIDQGLALYFPAPLSFTGESILEVHGHGGAIVLDQLLNREILP